MNDFVAAIKEAVLEFVRSNPNCTTRLIRGELANEYPGLRKQDVNRVLYSAETDGILIRKGNPQDGAPKWSSPV